MDNINKAIYFDMDGTIADFYGVDNWLDMLMNSDTTPYKVAKPLVNMNVLARYLNRLQDKGYIIGIVSWLSKKGNNKYNKEVTETKKKWLAKHLKSVKWNEVHIIKYGTPKHEVVNNTNGILFDDEEQNRTNWKGIAHDEKNIINVLKTIDKQ